MVPHPSTAEARRIVVDAVELYIASEALIQAAEKAREWAADAVRRSREIRERMARGADPTRETSP